MVDIPDSRIPNTAEPRAAFLAALAGLDDDALKFMALALMRYLGPGGHYMAAHAAAEAYMWWDAGVSPDATLPLPPRVP